MADALASGAVSFSCTKRFHAPGCARNRSPQKSQLRPLNLDRINDWPVSEVKLLNTTKSNCETSGSCQLTCQRAPPNGTQKPGRIRSYDSKGTFGHGESGDAPSN